MSRVSPDNRFRLRVASVLMGTIVGVILALIYAPQAILLLGFIGGALAWRLSGLIRSGDEEQYEEELRKHYHLPKELQDGYHTDLVMKRIMEIYHPGGETEAEDNEMEESDEEDNPDDRFNWPNEIDGTRDDEDQYSEPRIST